MRMNELDLYEIHHCIPLSRNSSDKEGRYGLALETVIVAESEVHWTVERAPKKRVLWRNAIRVVDKILKLRTNVLHDPRLMVIIQLGRADSPRSGTRLDNEDCSVIMRRPRHFQNT